MSTACRFIFIYIYIAPITFGGHFAFDEYFLNLRGYFMFFFHYYFPPRQSSLLLKTDEDRLGDLCDGRRIERKNGDRRGMQRLLKIIRGGHAFAQCKNQEPNVKSSGKCF